MEKITPLNRRSIGEGVVGKAHVGRTKINGKSKQIVYKVFTGAYHRTPSKDEDSPNFTKEHVVTQINKIHYDYALKELMNLRGKYSKIKVPRQEFREMGGA